MVQVVEIEKSRHAATSRMTGQHNLQSALEPARRRGICCSIELLDDPANFGLKLFSGPSQSIMGLVKDFGSWGGLSPC